MISRKIAARLLPAALILLLLPAFRAIPAAPLSRQPAVPDAFASACGLYVIDLATGEAVADINGSALFIPASVTKALTTASVLCIKDSAERFVTPAVALGHIGKDGTLDGNLLISCCGDPTIESRHMAATKGIADSIAAGLKAAGITRIAGRVIVDEAALPAGNVPSGWMDEDLALPYGAQHFAANYADNTLSFTMPGCTLCPASPGLEVSRESCKGGAKVSRLRSERRLRVWGTMPRRQTSMKVANPLPSSTLAEAVRAAIEAAGIAVEGKETASSGPATLIYTHVSPRYVDIMRSLMFRSDNLFAEGMLRTLAADDTRAEALAEEREIWADNDIAMCDNWVEDGSGLSRANRLSPQFLARVLEWMSRSLVSQSYVRLFPRAGCEGTVRNFLKDTPLAGRMVLKSGSMRNVQSYAGYMLDENGLPTHAVVIMANDFKCSRPALKQMMADALLEIFAPETQVTEEFADDAEYI